MTVNAYLVFVFVFCGKVVVVEDTAFPLNNVAVGVGLTTVVEASVEAAAVTVIVVVVSGAVAVERVAAGLVVVVSGPSPAMPSPSLGVSRFMRGLRRRARRRL